MHSKKSKSKLTSYKKSKSLCKENNKRKVRTRDSEEFLFTGKLIEPLHLEFKEGTGEKVGKFRKSTLDTMLRLINETYDEQIEKGIVFSEIGDEVYPTTETFEGGGSESHLGMRRMKIALPQGKGINGSFHTHFIGDITYVDPSKPSFGDVYKIFKMVDELTDQMEAGIPESEWKYSSPPFNFIAIGIRNKETNQSEIWMYEMKWDEIEKNVNIFAHLISEGMELENIFKRQGMNSVLFGIKEEQLNNYVLEHLTDLFKINIYVTGKENRWMALNEYTKL
jgi:hypothetical protein